MPRGTAELDAAKPLVFGKRRPEPPASAGRKPEARSSRATKPPASKPAPKPSKKGRIVVRQDEPEEEEEEEEDYDDVEDGHNDDDDEEDIEDAEEEEAEEDELDDDNEEDEVMDYDEEEEGEEEELEEEEEEEEEILGDEDYEDDVEARAVSRKGARGKAAPVARSATRTSYAPPPPPVRVSYGAAGAVLLGLAVYVMRMPGAGGAQSVWDRTFAASPPPSPPPPPPPRPPSPPPPKPSPPPPPPPHPPPPPWSGSIFHPMYSLLIPMNQPKKPLCLLYESWHLDVSSSSSILPSFSLLTGKAVAQDRTGGQRRCLCAQDVWPERDAMDKCMSIQLIKLLASESALWAN